MNHTGDRARGQDEDRDWQRLDKWLWCARLLRHRADCARLAAAGGIRLNRQPTDKPHARLRVGDVLTVPLHDEVRVLRIRALAVRRGPAAEAVLLYETITEAGSPVAAASCADAQVRSYPAPEADGMDMR